MFFPQKSHSRMFNLFPRLSTRVECQQPILQSPPLLSSLLWLNFSKKKKSCLLFIIPVNIYISSSLRPTQPNEIFTGCVPPAPYPTRCSNRRWTIDSLRPITSWWEVYFWARLWAVNNLCHFWLCEFGATVGGCLWEAPLFKCVNIFSSAFWSKNVSLTAHNRRRCWLCVVNTVRLCFSGVSVFVVSSLHGSFGSGPSNVGSVFTPLILVMVLSW